MKALGRGLFGTLLLVAAGFSMAANQKTQQQTRLEELPMVWARAATAGNVDQLIKLYADDAFIHVVFTSDELHGREQRLIQIQYTSRLDH